jgi:hypothetical protein
MAGVQGSQALIPVDTSVISKEPTGIESSLLASLLRKEGEVDNSENNVGNGNFHSSCIHYVFQSPSLLQLCHIYTQHSFKITGYN